MYVLINNIVPPKKENRGSGEQRDKLSDRSKATQIQIVSQGEKEILTGSNE